MGGLRRRGRSDIGRIGGDKKEEPQQKYATISETSKTVECKWYCNPQGTF